MTYKIHSPSGECILYVIMPKYPCLDHYSIRCNAYTVASALYIIKLLYNSTVSMVTDAMLL